MSASDGEKLDLDVEVVAVEAEDIAIKAFLFVGGVLFFHHGFDGFDLIAASCGAFIIAFFGGVEHLLMEGGGEFLVFAFEEEDDGVDMAAIKRGFDGETAGGFAAFDLVFEAGAAAISHLFIAAIA